MGSEQSQPVQGTSNSFTTGDLSAFSATLRDRDGALSPRQDSVCSDSEVPYVSYTVSKPIGDSPKKGRSSGSKYKFSAPKLSQRSASTTWQHPQLQVVPKTLILDVTKILTILLSLSIKPDLLAENMPIKTP